jgi:methylthioribulose-1-phosphate dehydratase
VNGLTRDNLEDATLEEVQQAFSRLRSVKEKFAQRGWFPATSGNLSVRIKNRSIIAVTTSGKDKSLQTPEDFLLVDLEGKPVCSTALNPSAETLIHAAIYKSIPNCEAVFHIHTVMNNLVSELYRDEKKLGFKDHELIKAFDIWEPDASISVPIVENYFDIQILANEIKNKIVPKVPGVLIRNHGIYVWGDSDFSATRHLEAFEFLFEYHIKLLLLKKL